MAGVFERHSVLIPASVLLAGAVTIGATATAIPATGQTVTICYERDSGAVRVLGAEAAQDCSRAENRLQFTGAESGTPHCATASGTLPGGPKLLTITP